tara:strand:+ start:1275 stop:1442 length:168 start_codon:yes stop_codon:yes gene_type:complete
MFVANLPVFNVEYPVVRAFCDVLSWSGWDADVALVAGMVVFFGHVNFAMLTRAVI